MNRMDAEVVLLDDGHVQFTHLCLNDEPIEATLPMPPWSVVESEPLRVEPSVHCTKCGWHGWIDHGAASSWLPGAPRSEPR